MQSIHKLLGATALAFSFLAASPVATATTQLFEFKKGAETTASGSFSYADGASGVLSFADLTAFNISINVPHTFQDWLPRTFNFSLTDVQAVLPSPAPAGRYFGFDTGTNLFVSTFDAPAPQLPYFGGGTAHATMAAYSSTPMNGFFIDWRPDGAVANSGIQAMSAGYGGLVNWNSYQISPVSEPSSILLAAAGLSMIGFMAGRRRRQT